VSIRDILIPHALAMSTRRYTDAQPPPSFTPRTCTFHISVLLPLESPRKDPLSVLCSVEGKERVEGGSGGGAARRSVSALEFS
jgi:hypothetical protein